MDKTKTAVKTSSSEEVKSEEVTVTPPQVEEVSELSFIQDEMRKVSALKKSMSEAQLAFVKGLVNKDLSDKELILFLGYANSLKLNPFNKEVIPVVYHKSDPNKRTVNVIVTRDGKRVVATRTGQLDSVISNAIYVKTEESTVMEMDMTDDGGKAKPTEAKIKRIVRVEPWEGGTLWGAEACVVRNGKEHRSIVPLSEYDSQESIWKTKKSTMIKKVAESQALSSAFPEILGAVYDDAEMPAIPAQTVDEQVLDIENPDALATQTQLDALRVMAPERFDEAGKPEKAFTRREVLEIMKEVSS